MCFIASGATLRFVGVEKKSFKSILPLSGASIDVINEPGTLCWLFLYLTLVLISVPIVQIFERMKERFVFGSFFSRKVTTF